MTTHDDFWQAARVGSLVLPACRTCGAKFFPPAPNCPSCRSDDWSWTGSAGVGTVYSHTTCQRPHIAGIDAPYVLAIVDLDDGWTLLTNIVGEDRLDARTGDRVLVRFENRPVGDDSRLAPVFTLDRSNT